MVYLISILKVSTGPVDSLCWIRVSARAFEYLVQIKWCSGMRRKEIIKVVK